MSANAKKKKSPQDGTVLVSREVLAELRASVDRIQKHLDALAGLAEVAVDPAEIAADFEDAADAATITHIRNLLASGKEDVIPAEVVRRLDAGESAVRVFREWRGMTQEQLAAAIAVNQSFISKIEAGTKHPTAANLGRLARALKVDADLLLPDD